MRTAARAGTLLLMVLVLGLTVFVDLITAVGAGRGARGAGLRPPGRAGTAGAAADASSSRRIPEEAALLRRARGSRQVFDFGGPLSFGAAADLGHHVR
jgi:SulP family sulfate permease